MAKASFARALLFTDALVRDLPPGIEIIRIKPLLSTSDYSRFILKDLGTWIVTSHCLVVQWDGFILDACAWDPEFLEFDYIGAPWPQFQDGYDVGNGGFSLRSRRLLTACANPGFIDDGQAEDVVIARLNRPWLEKEYGIRFGDRSTARRFSFERSSQSERTFGFHGVFNMPRAVGLSVFWETYRTLDEMQAVRTDFWTLLAQTARGPNGLKRTARMVFDRIRAGTR